MSHVCVTWFIWVTSSYVMCFTWMTSSRCVTWLMCVTWFTWVTWLIHMCDMTHPYVWHDSFLYGICFITHISIRVSLICHTCDIWETSLRCVCDIIHLSDMTHVCDTIHLSDMTHSYVWHDPFLHAIRFVHAHINKSVSHMSHIYTHTSPHICVRRHVNHYLHIWITNCTYGPQTYMCEVTCNHKLHTWITNCTYGSRTSHVAPKLNINES